MGVEVTVTLDADFEAFAERWLAGQSGEGAVRIYAHALDGEGACPECEPYIGKVIGGDVPEPPLHPNCLCFALDAGVAALEGPDLTALHIAWLKSLTFNELSAVLGHERAALVAAGKEKIEDFYSAAHRLKPLKGQQK